MIIAPRSSNQTALSFGAIFDVFVLRAVCLLERIADYVLVIDRRDTGLDRKDSSPLAAVGQGVGREGVSDDRRGAPVAPKRGSLVIARSVEGGSE